MLESGKIRFVLRKMINITSPMLTIITNDEASDVELVKQGTSTSWFNYDPSSDWTLRGYFRNEHKHPRS